MGASVVSVAQFKGGVGKTTTSLSIAGYLARRGRTLLIDMDGQENLTVSLGLDLSESEDGDGTIASVIKHGVSIYEIIQGTNERNLYIAPGHYTMDYADYELAAATDREWLLDRALEPIKSDLDYIVIDTKPSLNLATTMSIIASDLVLVPLKLDYYSLRGLNLFIRYLNSIMTACGVEPEVRFVCTMRRQTNLASEIEAMLRERLQDQVYKTVIPLNVALEEAPTHYQTIATYDPRSSGGMAYEALVQEILNDLDTINSEEVA